MSPSSPTLQPIAARRPRPHSLSSFLSPQSPTRPNTNQPKSSPILGTHGHGWNPPDPHVFSMNPINFGSQPNLSEWQKNCRCTLASWRPKSLHRSLSSFLLCNHFRRLPAQSTTSEITSCRGHPPLPEKEPSRGNIWEPISRCFACKTWGWREIRTNGLGWTRISCYMS